MLSNWLLEKKLVSIKMKRCMQLVFWNSLIFIIRKKKINEGIYQLDTTVKYVSAVNDFPGSYKPEGSGSLPKKEDNKEYSLKDLITKVSKESDNVAHNILGYYISNQSDATFKSKMSAIMGDDWDPKEKLISSKMAGKVMEAIYNQKWICARVFD